MKFGIVILNYKNYAETIQCVRCFMAEPAFPKNADIVIVDNGSGNESVEVLEKEFGNQSGIYVHPLSENLGFAKGNNAGYYFLKEKGDYDFIVFSNSDITFKPGILNWIEEEYCKEPFATLGPDIHGIKLGYHQNPLPFYTTSLWKLNLKIVYKRFRRLYLRLFRPTKAKEMRALTAPTGVPHGAFIIASKDYFSVYDEMFDPRTFLYMEEHILHVRCKKAGLKESVRLSFTVEHHQGASTATQSKGQWKRAYNRMGIEIDSLRIYKKVLKGQ